MKKDSILNQSTYSDHRFDYVYCKKKLDDIRKKIEENHEEIGDLLVGDIYNLLSISEQIMEWNYHIDQKSSLANVNDLKGLH